MPAPRRSRERPGAIGLRRLDPPDWELVHPRCVADRRDDHDEALDVWRAGEPDEAREILRHALEGCGDNCWIHVALGRIALEVDRDPTLARGHFGYVVELAARAIPEPLQGRLDPNRPANRPLHDALEGLARCLDALGDPRSAAATRARAARWRGDPA